MNILLDMNVSPEWVVPLETAGFICRHWSTVGEVTAPDAVIFHWAAANNFIVCTHDLDFGAILAATNARFPSVIQIRRRNFFPDNPDIVSRFIGYIHQYSNLLQQGALVTVDEQRSKVRILPLHI